jgi:hypothetical protein
MSVLSLVTWCLAWHGVAWRANIRAVRLKYYTGRLIMHSGITKIYVTKTVGHVFTKPVQIEGTTQKYFPQKVVFHRISHFCPLTAEDNIERVRASVLHSPKKSTGTAAKELWMLKTTVWRVLRKRLVFKPYRIQMVQQLLDEDHRRRRTSLNALYYPMTYVNISKVQ